MSLVTDLSPSPLSAVSTFGAASRELVAALRDRAPLACWAVTRFDGARQVVLAVSDHTYGIDAGTTCWWADTLCQAMVTGRGPQVAPVAMSVAAYRAAPLAESLPIGAYAGAPIRRASGQLFGTVFGIDPEPRADGLASLEPLLSAWAAGLEATLERDLSRVSLARVAEREGRRVHADPLTGLTDVRGWERALEREDRRCRDFGDPAAVVVIELDPPVSPAASDGPLTVVGGPGDPAARRARRAARVLAADAWSTDVLARLGEDRFALLATDTGPGEAARLVERISTGLFEAGLAASVGMAPFNPHTGFPGAVAAADAQRRLDQARRQRAERELQMLLPA